MTKEAGKKIEAGTRVTTWKNGVHLAGTVVASGWKFVQVAWDGANVAVNEEAWRLRHA